MKKRYLIMVVDDTVDSVLSLTDEDELVKENFMRKLRGDSAKLGQEIILRTFITRAQYNTTHNVYSIYEVKADLSKRNEDEILKIAKKGEKIF